jgi:hypothetical protein
MSDLEPPKSKYQCLLDAAANSGLAEKLPPIKPGTEVEERAFGGNDALPPPRDTANFFYKGADGKENYIDILDGLANGDVSEGRLERTKHFSFTTFERDGSFSSDYGPHSVVGVETGKEANYGPPAKQGTIGETVDKFLKCRDPAMS